MAATASLASASLWAAVPHYVAATPSPKATLALVERAARHLGVHIPVDSLVERAKEERVRLDAVVAERPEAQAYLSQLEAAGPAPVIPPGEDIAAEVERFLRETTGERRNPFEGPGAGPPAGD